MEKDETEYPVRRALSSTRSEKLSEFKKLISTLPELQGLIGEIAEFRVVVDTSAVLADLIWISRHRNDKQSRTSLIEIIEAQTIVAYAPLKLIAEVEEHLPRIATENGLTLEILRQEWQAYRTNLKISEPEAVVVERHLGGGDPEDAPFVALAEVLSAHGIVTRDKDIKRMGGTALTLDFIITVRDYSRAMAVEVNIKFMGIALTLVSIGVVTALVESIKGLIAATGRLPDWVKIAILFGAVFVLVHPGARGKLKNLLEKTFNGIKAATPHVLQTIGEASLVAQEHGALAEKQLDRALEEINKGKSSITRMAKKRVVHRRRRIRRYESK